MYVYEITIHFRKIWVKGSTLFRDQNGFWWNSLAIQCSGLCALTAESLGLVPGWGSKIAQATWYGQPPQKQKGVLHASHHLLQTFWGRSLNPSLLKCGLVCRSFPRAVWQCGHCKKHRVILCVISPTLMTAQTMTCFNLSLGKLRPSEWTGQSWVKKNLFLSCLLGFSGGGVVGGDWSLLLASFLSLLCHHLLAQCFTPISLPKKINMNHSCQHASR